MKAEDSERGPAISGVVICGDEADGIERCLESLAFCDEIVVVTNATDDTPSLAARHTDRVIRQSFLGYVKQKNFALDQATHDWVVCLDADEALSPELAGAIQEAIHSGDESVSGYVLDRMTSFLGVLHDAGEWYPDPQLRVFRRSRGRWTGRDPHDRVSLEGPSRQLQGVLWHYNYRDLSDHVRTVDRFSALQARGMHEEGIRFRLPDLLLRPLARFIKGYVVRGGYRKGVAGLLVSISTAYYVFMKYAKLWEIERKEKK